MQHPQAVAMQPLIEHGDKEITSKEVLLTLFILNSQAEKKKKKCITVFIAEHTVFCVGIVDKQK